MELSNNLDEAISQAKSHLRRDIQVKLLVRHQGREFESSTVFIRKIVPEKLEQIRKELVMRFGTNQFEKIYMEITKLVRKVNCPNCNKEMRSNHLFRHLKTCIKNKFCPICQKDISEGSINEHVEECGKTYYPCNVCGKRFNTATKRTTHEMNIKNSKVKADKRFNTGTTHEMNIKNSKVKADFGRFKIITINIQPDYLITLEVTLEDKVEHITDILNHEMKSSLKFYISAYVKINLDGGKYIAEHFQIKATLLTKAEIIEEEVKSHCNIIHDKIEEYYKRRNAREIVDIKSIDIMMTDYS